MASKERDGRTSRPATKKTRAVNTREWNRRRKKVPLLALRISAEYCSDRLQLAFGKTVPIAVLRVVPLGNHVPVKVPQFRSESITASCIETRGVPSQARFGNARRNVRRNARAPLNANPAIGRCFFVHYPEQLEKLFITSGAGVWGVADRIANGTHDERQRWADLQLRVADDAKPCGDGHPIV